MFQRQSIEKLHGNERLAVLVVNFVDRADVGMVQGGSGLRFALETCKSFRVLSNLVGQVTASYGVKHAAHVTVTGAILQRTNHVTLVSKGTVCEMQVVSNFSGWEHNDKGDFRKRVDESLAKLKAATPSEPAQPAAPAK